MLLKLADRIDNLRDSLNLPDTHKNQAFKHRYTKETREHYIPMAEKLGNEKVLALLQDALAKLG